MIGPNNPSAATESAAGCLSCPGSDWTNFANVYANDMANVSTQMTAFPSCFQTACFYSRDLYATGFGFAIPATATIAGIVVEIKKNSATATTTMPIRDSVVSLMTSPGTLVGQNKRLMTPWPSISTYSTYGNSTDLWGTAWTPAEINNTGFGVALKAKNVSNTLQSAFVDHIRITVYYTLAIGIVELSSQTSEITMFPNPASSSVTVINSSEAIESVVIYDMLGKIVYQSEIKNKKYDINVDALNKGIYFIQTKDSEGKITTSKFIKE